MALVPSAQNAANIAERVLGAPVRSVTRFTTGLANHVFDAVAESGGRVVVRMAPADSTEGMGPAVFWNQRLRVLGVPLPELLAVDAEDGTKPPRWIVLQRLPGEDLGHVYATLTLEQKHAIAAGVVEAQRRTLALSEGGGYGFVSYPRDWPQRTWTDVVRHGIDRTRRRIDAVGVVDARHVDRVVERMPRFESHFATVRPTPFLDDTTTKNVMISQGRLTGIVDVDCICYGDVLSVLGLTRMALLNLGHDTQYVEMWLDMIDATRRQRAVVELYAALSCLDFLGELGQQFNRDVASPVASEDVHRLVQVLDALLMGL